MGRVLKLILNHSIFSNMKKIVLYSINKSRKCLALIAALLFCCLQLVAAPEDHGRWYSVDDSGGSFFDTLGIIVMCILGLPVAFISAKEWLSGKMKDDNSMGCMSVAAIAAFILFVVVKCS